MSRLERLEIKPRKRRLLVHSDFRKSMSMHVILSAPIPSLISKFLGQQSSIMSYTMRERQVIVKDFPGDIVDDFPMPFF